MFNNNHIDSFYQSIYTVAFFKARLFQTISRHHGREPDIVILSPANSDGYLGHNIVRFDILNLAINVITHTRFQKITSAKEVLQNYFFQKKYFQYFER